MHGATAFAQLDLKVPPAGLFRPPLTPCGISKREDESEGLVVLSGLALLEADARFHAEQLALYRVRRSGAGTTTERRLEDLAETSRRADARLGEARAAVAGPGAPASFVRAGKSDKVLDGADRRRLDHVTPLLESGETTECVGDGLFQSGTRQCRGIAVLTDRRLLCIDPGARTCMTFELSLADTTSVCAGVAEGVGAAKRGVIELVTAGVATTVSRLDPWRLASEIAMYIEEWEPAPTGADVELQTGPKHWAGTEAPAHAWGPCAELNLASDDGAPGRVRRTLRVICAGSDGGAIADAELAVTEVVTNAVLHAGGDGVSISFWSEGSILDVLVSDGGPGFTPLLARRDIDEISGRGLSIVDTVAESWGSSICAPSSVWMRLPMPESIAPPSAHDPEPRKPH